MNPHSLATANPISQASIRRAREAEERRLAILRAAELVFGDKGYHGASIQIIAAEAGFGTGTIYLYFADKAELYGSVLVEKLRQMVAGVKNALSAEGSTAMALRAFVLFHFTFHEANRQFFEIFLNQAQMEVTPLNGKHWAELEALKMEQLTCLRETIAAGQAAGELRSGEPRMYAIAFLGMVLQMVRQHIREGGAGPLRDSAEFAADCFLHGAAADPRSTPISI